MTVQEKAVLAERKEPPAQPLNEIHWFKRLEWFRMFIIWGIPLLGFIGATQVALHKKTAILMIVYYFISGISLSAGYHRLWSHRAYTATAVTRFFLAFFAASVGEGNAYTWARDHRAHHRFTDTDQDPYSVHKGLFYAHFGWIIFTQDRSLTGRTDVSDLKNDKIVMWQRRNYMSLFVLTAFVLPTVFAGLLWGDWWGGLVYAGAIRMFIVQQSTFFINSIAHSLGDQTYSDRHSPRDSVITSFLTGGEGYHNYHHEFPMDYRSGVRWYHYDPPKWTIYILSLFGMTSDLKQFPDNEVSMGAHQQKMKKLNREGKGISWGTPVDDLPLLTWAEYTERASGGHHLICLKGVIYDVAPFVHQHPGGTKIILSYVGKDATEQFFGGVYAHSNGAENLLCGMRYARLVEETK
ncbi:stearic acid desaturase [Aspergillus indologenus CBS 114.80]|uniref:Acyl-CoA desaturase n=1 Tax=Aspergillus indologenus CBS 114.80 TaxID=1450541 RepID=A0A2V5ICC5_9EURO|nr:stearic acid desaturase [Aspergillus indologenus CBS 114.80]